MTLIFKAWLLCLLHSAAALELLDDQGKQIKLTQAPQRIVSYTLASDEILLALAKPEQIAALSPLAGNPRYSYISKAAAAYPQIHNVEEIIAFKADLVLLATYNQTDIRSFLDKAQIPSFYLSRFENIADIQRHIRQLGILLARETQAEQLIIQFQQDLSRAKAALNCQLPALLSYDQWGYVAGFNTIFQALLDYLDIENLAANIKGYQRLQIEWIYQQQPKIIIVSADIDAFAAAKARILEHPLLKHTPAAQQGRLITLDQRYLNSNSQYLAQGLAALVQQLKPYCANPQH